MATRNLATEAREHWKDAQRYHRRFQPGRDALYKLCASARHDDIETTVSKLWLVGRSHSAALERTHVPYLDRRKEVAWHAAKGLQRLHLDDRLAALRESGDAYSAKRKGAITDCVHAVAEVLQDASGQWKLSLATKYLRFHDPAVPIFDSISDNVYRWFEERRGQGKGTYRAHIERFARVRDGIAGLGNAYAPATARTIDHFAMYWWFD